MSARVRDSLLPALALLVLACSSLTTFTRGYRENLSMQDGEVMQVQFFTSDEIVLQRQSALQQRSNVGSALSISSKTKLQEVVIPKGTPGVVLQIVRVRHDEPPEPMLGTVVADADAEYLLVSFSAKKPEKALWFSTQRAKVKGRYELTHVVRMEERDGELRPLFSPGFLLRYDGEDYRLAEAEMWEAHLEIDEDFITDEEIDRESPPGWRLRPAGSRAPGTKLEVDGAGSVNGETAKPEQPTPEQPTPAQ